jgi:hypothetical protein
MPNVNCRPRVVSSSTKAIGRSRFNRPGTSIQRSQRSSTGVSFVSWPPVTAEDQHAADDAVDVLGASEVLGDMTAILYGDAAAAALGWAPAGIAEHGGYRWAIDQAGRRIKDLSAPSTLRAIAVS